MDFKDKVKFYLEEETRRNSTGQFLKREGPAPPRKRRLSRSNASLAAEPDAQRFTTPQIIERYRKQKIEYTKVNKKMKEVMKAIRTGTTQDKNIASLELRKIGKKLSDVTDRIEATEYTLKKRKVNLKTLR